MPYLCLHLPDLCYYLPDLCHTYASNFQTYAITLQTYATPMLPLPRPMPLEDKQPSALILKCKTSIRASHVEPLVLILLGIRVFP